MDISISMELKTAAPNLCLGCVTASVKMRKTNDDLWAVIDKHIQYLTVYYEARIPGQHTANLSHEGRI